MNDDEAEHSLGVEESESGQSAPKLDFTGVCAHAASKIGKMKLLESVLNELNRRAQASTVAYKDSAAALFEGYEPDSHYLIYVGTTGPLARWVQYMVDTIYECEDADDEGPSYASINAFCKPLLSCIEARPAIRRLFKAWRDASLEESRSAFRNLMQALFNDPLFRGIDLSVLD